MMAQLQRDERFAYMLPVIMTMLVLIYLSAIYFAYFIADISKDMLWTSVLLATTFAITLVLLMISYIRSVIADPGIAPENMVHESLFVTKHRSPVKQLHRNLSLERISSEGGNNFTRGDTVFSPDRKEHVEENHPSNASPFDEDKIDILPWTTETKDRNLTVLTSETFIEFENIAQTNEENDTTAPILPQLKRPLFYSPESVAKEFQFCFKCNRVKPPRCHHCSTCKRCVLRMDHHCPWIGNCVGFENHKYFVLFLFYTTLATFQEALSFSIALSYGIGYADETLKTSYLLGVIIPSSICIGVGGLLFFHIYLLVKNLSTIEVNFFDKNPFDTGSKMKNIEQIFGVNKLLWLIPVLPKDRTTDGMNYPVIQEAI